jgi:hypothetical protein
LFFRAKRVFLGGPGRGLGGCDGAGSGKTVWTGAGFGSGAGRAAGICAIWLLSSSTVLIKD